MFGYLKKLFKRKPEINNIMYFCVDDEDIVVECSVEDKLEICDQVYSEYVMKL